MDAIAFAVEQPSGGAGSVWQIWCLAGMAALVAYVLGRTLPYLGVLLAAVAVWFSIGLLVEFSDAATAGGLATVFGPRYVLNAKIASLAVAVAPVGALSVGWIRKRHAPRAA